MAKTIDSLQLEIKANSQGVEKALDSLIQSLENLNKASTQSSTGLGKLASVSKQIKGTFGKLGSSISLFSNRTKNVSKNIYNANSHFNKTRGITSKLASAFDKTSKSADKAGNIFDKIASKVGRLYNNFWMLKRGLNSLWNAIKSSMDYVETLNYFDASFGQVAEKAVSNFREAGYDSAEAYYNSFADRANQLTKKLSGFTLDATGMLQSTGEKSLGLDPDSTLKYQAQFAQMASSMGVASENALVLSNVLTEIGADLASVKNLDFEKVWGDMASGLVGMSRTLDKYGVNIRNANMQAKLAELGINANVNALSQADKALLRTIILLDSTKYAWGDLADTLNQPANQLRLVTANFKNLCRMIGNLFLPLVAKVLPYINALLIALQRLVSLIAKFFGIDMSGITSSVGGGGGGDALSDILDEADELGDSLDDDAESAKKLKQNLLGVDELNIISEDQSGSGNDKLGGIGGLLDDAFLDALSDYQLAWDEAFKNLENKANELADKIAEFFKKLWSPIAKAWEKEGKNLVESWKKAFKSVGETLKSIGSDAMEVWLEPETVRLFENLFHIVADMGQVVEALSDNFRKAWDEADRGKNILRAVRDIAVGITEQARLLADRIVLLAKDTDFAPILESIKNVVEAIANQIDNIAGIFADIVYNFLLFKKYLLEDFFPRLLQLVADFINAVDFEKLRDNLNRIGYSIEQIAEALGGVLLVALTKVKDVLVDFINGDFFDRLAQGFENFANSLKNAKSLGDYINAIFDFGDLGIELIVEKFNSAVNAIDNFLKKLESIDPSTGMKPIKQIGERLGGWINDIFKNLDASKLGDTIGNFAKTLLDLISSVISEVDWFTVGYKIGEALAKLDWGQILLKVVKIALQLLGGLIEAWAGSMLSAPISTGILTAIGLISFTKHAIDLVTRLASALTGNTSMQIISSAIGKLFANTKIGDSIGKLGLESTKLSDVALNAKNASKMKELFNTANGNLANVTNTSAKELTTEATEMGAVATASTKATSAIGGIIKTIAGIGGVVVGATANIGGFVSAITDGFSWAKEAVMVLGTAIAGVGAVLLGAPATVTAVVAGIVLVVENLVIFLKENWASIKEWFSNLGEWLSTYIGQPIAHFFTETLPNAFTSFAEWVGGITRSVGEKLVAFKDKVVEIANNVANKVVEIAHSIGEWLGSVAESIGTFFVNAFNTVSEWLGRIWENISSVLGNIWDTVSGILNNIWETVSGFFSGVWDSLSNFFSSAWSAISGFIDSVWSGLQNLFSTIGGWISNCWENVSGFIQRTASAIGSFISEAFGKISDFLGNTWNKAKEFFGNLGERLGTFVSDTITNLKDFFSNAWDKTKGFFSDVVTHVSDNFGGIIQKSKDFFGDVFGKVKNFFQDAFNTTRDKLSEIKTTARGMLEKIPDWMRDFGNNTIMGWVRGVREKLSDAWDAVKDFGSGVLERVKDVLGIHSPSKEFYSIAQYSLKGYENGVTDEKKGALKALEDVAKESLERFDGLDKKFNDVGINIGKNFTDGLKETSSMSKDVLRELVSYIVETIRSSMDTVNGVVLQGISNLRMQLNDLISSYNTFQQNMNNMNYYGSGGGDYYIPAYASGGFPEDGLFFANHNELVGGFNGKTAVANNQEITDGIRNAVYDAMVSANSNNREEELLEELISAVRKGSKISIDGREIVNAYDNRKVRNGYSFT